MKAEIYGIDHGYGYMKTPHASFVSGVTMSAGELPHTEGVLVYENKWYAIGGNRLPYMPDKTANDNYFILTLAALAEEMKARGVRMAHVAMAAGLPLTRYSYEKESFRAYLSRKKEIAFTYEGEHYHVRLTSVDMFPQGYAAVTWYMLTQKKQQTDEYFILADLGSGTFEIALFHKNRPQMDAAYSVTIGMNNCYRDVNEKLRQKFYGYSVPEPMIDAIILDKPVRINHEYKEVIENGCREFAATIKNTLQDYGYNLAMIPVYWMGGGAAMMKKYGSLPKDMNEFICVPEANALGYELLLKGKWAAAKKAEKQDGKKSK